MTKKLFLLALLLMFLISGCAPKKELTLNSASILSDGKIHIEGRGRAFENTIGVKIVDENGLILYQGSVMTNAQDMSKFGDFSQDINLNYFPQTDNIVVECFIASAKDGSITASEKKTLKYDLQYEIIKVFFSNTKLNPNAIDCAKVFPVERRISKNDPNPPLSAIKFLLLGPTQKESDEGYLVVTPNNLTINYIKPEGKNVQIDFGAELLQAGGGSCRVTAIRAEISETLLQFYPGYNVIISSNGNIEEVLQP